MVRDMARGEWSSWPLQDQSRCSQRKTVYRIIFAPKNDKIVILATSLLSVRDFTPFLNSLEHETTCIIILSPFFKSPMTKKGEKRKFWWEEVRLYRVSLLWDYLLFVTVIGVSLRHHLTGFCGTGATQNKSLLKTAGIVICS